MGQATPEPTDHGTHRDLIRLSSGFALRSSAVWPSEPGGWKWSETWLNTLQAHSSGLLDLRVLQFCFANQPIAHPWCSDAKMSAALFFTFLTTEPDQRIVDTGGSRQATIRNQRDIKAQYVH